jgi:hypothetical protein
MMVTHFAIMTWKKLNEKPPKTKEEIYRAMKAEYEARRQAARPAIAKLDAISTPRDGAKMMAAIGTVQQMRDALRPSPDQADAMAMGAIGRFS